jgi:hypothetical protein
MIGSEAWVTCTQYHGRRSIVKEAYSGSIGERLGWVGESMEVEKGDQYGILLRTGVLTSLKLSACKLSQNSSEMACNRELFMIPMLNLVLHLS